MDLPRVLVGTVNGIHSVGDKTVALEGHFVDHISGDSLLAVSDGGTVWAHADDEWHSIAAVTEHKAHCVLEVDDRVLVGASDASLLELRGGEVRRVTGFDGTPGRDSWFTPWGAPADARSMTRGAHGVIYVNVHVGGIAKSTDNGTTWTDTLDIQADVHEVAARSDRPSDLFAACAWGLAVTDDGGDTWEFVDEGLPSSYCRSIALSADSVFVSASEGHHGRHSAVYRRPAVGGAFARCTEGLPEWFSNNINTFGLAAKGSFVVAGDPNGTVYASEDDGTSWSIVAEGLPELTCLAIA